jgi:RNA polymerase sigma-70 factor (ECF subfamily)
LGGVYGAAPTTFWGLRLKMTLPVDSHLVPRAQCGEHRAFNLLLGKYRNRLVTLSMRYTHNRADAEDAVQEALLKAYRGLPHFRGEAAFYSWLFRIAINSAKSVLSLRSRDDRFFKSDRVIGHEIRETAEVADSPEHLAMTEEIAEALQTAIETLCDEQRAAIVLCEWEGLSYCEIASSMSCPVGTVRSRVFRARETIDHQLRPFFEEGLGRARHRGQLAAVANPIV